MELFGTAPKKYSSVVDRNFALVRAARAGEWFGLWHGGEARSRRTLTDDDDDDDDDDDVAVDTTRK
jgi:hypothetical protein